MNFVIASLALDFYDEMLDNYPVLKDFRLGRKETESEYFPEKLCFATININTLDELMSLIKAVGHHLIINEGQIIICDQPIE